MSEESTTQHFYKSFQTYTSSYDVTQHKSPSCQALEQCWPIWCTRVFCCTVKDFLLHSEHFGGKCVRCLPVLLYKILKHYLHKIFSLHICTLFPWILHTCLKGWPGLPLSIMQGNYLDEVEPTLWSGHSPRDDKNNFQLLQKLNWMKHGGWSNYSFPSYTCD